MMNDKPQSKPFKQIIEEDFAALETYLLADDSQVDEVWEQQLAGSELLEIFTKKVVWKIRGFNRRYNINQQSAEGNSLAFGYTGEVLTNLRKKCREKNNSAIDVNEISKELHLSLRRVDDFLRKPLEIPYPPKPLVRLYHLRKYTLKAINSNPRAKIVSEADISSFMNRLRDKNNPAAKFIFDRFNDDLRQRLLSLTWENTTDKTQNEILRQICKELNSLIKEYDGECNEKKQIKHHPPFMFFGEFSRIVGEDEKIKYPVPLTNRYKNREILSKVFPEISRLKSVSFSEISENTVTDKSQFYESKVESIEKLFDLFIKLPRVTKLVKDFWARVEFCVSEFCEDNPEIYLFKFLVEEGKWTDKAMDDKLIKKCILVFCDYKEARFRRYKLNLRKAWKRVCEGNGKELYERIGIAS